MSGAGPRDVPQRRRMRRPPVTKEITGSSVKARIRCLRQACRCILNSRDARIVSLLQRFQEQMSNVELRELNVLYRVNTAREMSESTGISWVEVATQMADKFDADGRTAPLVEI